MQKSYFRVKMVIFIIFLFSAFSAFLFPIVATKQMTFSQVKQNEQATMEKYQNDWNDTSIHQKPLLKPTYVYGDQIATITIPKMNLFEYPIYYGSDPVLNNWQITTPGHFGNWSLFGEVGVTCVGAHNYQLFKNLKVLEVGDKIIVETTIDRYVYVVDSVGIYNHELDDWDNVATKHKESYALNLMTCYPFDAIKTKDMYIVYTTLQKGTIFN